MLKLMHSFMNNIITHVKINEFKHNKCYYT